MLYNFKFDKITKPLIIVLVFDLILLFLLLLLDPTILKKKLKNNNEHGSSRFASVKEIKRTFTKSNLNNIIEAGFPVYYERKLGKFKNVYFDNKSPHFLLVGSTGSGKSVTVSIPMAIHFALSKVKHSVVLTDPKGELYKLTSGIFKNNGYEIITIDFRNPTKSNKINIMKPIIDEWKEHCQKDKKMLFLIAYFFKKNKISISKMNQNNYKNKIIEKYQLNDLKDVFQFRRLELQKTKIDKTSDWLKEIKDMDNLELMNLIKDNYNLSIKHKAETNRLIFSLANLIFNENANSDPFWINSAKQLFEGIAGLFIEEYKAGNLQEEQISIANIKKFQNSSLLKSNQVFLQKNLSEREYGSLSKDYLIPILSSAENTYKSITAVFAEKMAIFDDVNVESITSISEFDFKDVGRKATAFYIIVPDEDKSYNKLITIILGMLIKDLTKLANLKENNGVLPIKIEWLLDEFANCPPLDSIETTISVARSRGMRFYLFIQSFSQLNQIYGKDIASIIEDNCALVYLKTNTIETAEVISKKLGRETVITSSLSSGGKSESLMGKDLMSATEIIALKYKTIIFPTISHPIFRDTYMYNNLYPYLKFAEVDRLEKVLDKSYEYFTVENMIEASNSSTYQFEQDLKSKAKNELQYSGRIIQRKILDEKNFFANFLYSIKEHIKLPIISEKDNEETYVIEISGLLNSFQIQKIKQVDVNYLSKIEVERMTQEKKTRIIIYKNIKGEK